MFGFKKWRRKRLMKKPFPDQWDALLNRNVPYIQHLPSNLQAKLKGLVHVFIDEKKFEGCAGLEITDEIRVTIAAQASILMLGIDDLSSFYNDLRSVLVYPKPYVVKIKSRHNSFFVQEGFQRRRGEAWSRGHVVLAWNEVKKGASDIHDGQNLAFHEFAHQLDYEYGATDQVENNYNNESHFLSWARVVGSEYQKLLQAIKRDQKTLIDDYGGTNLAEFFAVITECFFEKPRELKEKHPDLYQQLQNFYQQDPASYITVS
ncbi:zinc-dependent peptidase [Aliifodinibius salicampi]|uniref:Zinc-dependent peptidase n=1 Tax=Fodinibius salicampi TaxID=1920655 RepID=A0ABT3Q2Q5_9BACT|nr:M90 family metallopeptidase [Fodinibius salicampi]MCW9714394.1 zinc-dependent peptidase [Fodinibius salicampi]